VGLAAGGTESAAWECQPYAVQREGTRLRTLLAGGEERAPTGPRMAPSGPVDLPGRPRRPSCADLLRAPGGRGGGRGAVNGDAPGAISVGQAPPPALEARAPHADLPDFETLGVERLVPVLRQYRRDIRVPVGGAEDVAECLVMAAVRGPLKPLAVGAALRRAVVGDGPQRPAIRAIVAGGAGVALRGRRRVVHPHLSLTSLVTGLAASVTGPRSRILQALECPRAAAWPGPCYFRSQEEPAHAPTRRPGLLGVGAVRRLHRTHL